MPRLQMNKRVRIGVVLIQDEGPRVQVDHIIDGAMLQYAMMGHADMIRGVLQHCVDNVMVEIQKDLENAEPSDGR
jgi:hypothetical protein